MRAAALAEDPGGRPAVRLHHEDDEVIVALHGAQVLSWRHRGRDVLWTASDAVYADDRPVRGGIPVVFPWFGFHPTGDGLPQHGFARNLPWRVAELREGPTAVLALEDDAGTRVMWPHRFALELAVTLREHLRLRLTIVSHDALPFRCEEALHTYLAAGDVRTATVHGLEGVPYVEHAAAPEADPDPGVPIAFRAETDRVFQGVPERIELRTPALHRRVLLCAPAARSAIVWTPWPAKAARLSQLGPDDWTRFCCVETANVKENALRLAPGGSHALALELTVAAD